MRCLGNLLEFCPPGTLPEASVLTAMLDLQAPILARAAFFFECAQFVHRCNQGRWPEWMKLTSSQYRQSGPISRLIAAAPRKQNILQRTAGKVFYEWARSLTLRLEDILRAEHVDPTSVVSPTLIPEEEDYLLVGGDNLEPGNCPFALKLALCQLLLEITAFLRETYRTLPRREKYGTMRASQGRGPAGDKRLASRRWSSVASTSGGASHQSIQSFVENGQIHTIAAGKHLLCLSLTETKSSISF
jgi:protein unc-80